MEILIVSKSTYLSQGIVNLLPKHVTKNITLSSASLGELNDLSNYDILIIDIRRNQLGLCLESFKTRKMASRLFFIQSERNELEPVRCLNCWQDAVIIRREMKLDEIRNIFNLDSGGLDYKKYDTCSSMCCRCNPPYLTNMQHLILVGLKYGFTTRDIASTICVSQKTVFSHINRIKLNFHLKNDIDIKMFLENEIVCNKPIKAI